MGEEGDMATWIGQGVGTMKKDGGVSYRGAVSLSNFVCQMVSAEQRGRDLRVRGGRPGKQSLPILGMEVGKPPNDVTKRAASYWAWFAVGHVNPKPSIERENEAIHKRSSPRNHNL